MTIMNRVVARLKNSELSVVTSEDVKKQVYSLARSLQIPLSKSAKNGNAVGYFAAKTDEQNDALTRLFSKIVKSGFTKVSVKSSDKGVYGYRKGGVLVKVAASHVDGYQAVLGIYEVE